MNISNLSSVTGNPQPVAWTTPTQPDGPSDAPPSRPHGAHHHHHRAPKIGEAAETSTTPDTDGDQDDAQRVSTLARRIDARLQNAITDSNLTSDQATALRDAATKFQDLMTRIGNADGADGKKRAVHFALQQLGQQIQGIFDAQSTSAPAASASGADIAAAIVAPPVDTVG